MLPMLFWIKLDYRVLFVAIDLAGVVMLMVVAVIFIVSFGAACVVERCCITLCFVTFWC